MTENKLIPIKSVYVVKVERLHVQYEHRLLPSNAFFLTGSI